MVLAERVARYDCRSANGQFLELGSRNWNFFSCASSWSSNSSRSSILSELGRHGVCYWFRSISSFLGLFLYGESVFGQAESGELLSLALNGPKVEFLVKERKEVVLPERKLHSVTVALENSVAALAFGS